MNILQENLGDRQDEGAWQRRRAHDVVRADSDEFILKKYVRCAACLKTVKGSNKSGLTENDGVSFAAAMFNRRTVSHPREDVGNRSFFFRADNCYAIC